MARDRASNDGAGEIIHNRDRVDRVWTKQVILNVPHVNRPILMPSRSLKGISFGASGSFFGPFRRIVTSVESQESTARSGGEFDPNVFEGCMHPPFAQFRIFLKFSHLIDGLQRHFPLWLFGRMAFVVKPSHSFVNPAFEDGVDRLSTGFK
jgi:hypothetical protein